MSLYTYDGDKINTAALCESMEYAQDAQRIESGAFFDYVSDLVRVYGGMAK